MIYLNHHLARVLWPDSIWPLIDASGLIGLAWDELALIKGSWMETAGLSLEHHKLNVDEDGNLRGFGSSIGMTYNNDHVQLVQHRAGTTVRAEFDGGSYELRKLGRGPRCCVKPGLVRTIHRDNEEWTQIIEGPNGNDQILKFDKLNRIISHRQGRSNEKRYEYIFGRGPARLLFNDTVQTYEYDTGSSGLPKAIVGKGRTDFVISRNVDGAVHSLSSGNTVLLDFSQFILEIDEKSSIAAKSLKARLTGEKR
ncbi:hypothetical protein [Vibrio phage vB_pir03]|nr:hypothetical protein [Vibrio phage vB_pir03]